MAWSETGGNRFLVEKSQHQTATAPIGPWELIVGEKWFYSDNGREAGPFSFDQLKWLVANNRLSPEDLVWSEGMSDWVPAAEIRELFSAEKAIRIKPPPLPKSASGLQKLPNESQQQEPMTSASRPPAPNQAKPVSHTAAKASSAQSEASSGIGTVTVCRKPKPTGFLYAVKVLADGQLVGEIPGGVLDLLAGRERELEFHLPSGTHSIEVTGCGSKGSVTVNVPADKDVNLVTSFSNLGAPGGGLRIFTEESLQSALHDPSSNLHVGAIGTSSSNRLSRRTLWIAGGAAAALVSMCLCCGIGSWPGASTVKHPYFEMRPGYDFVYRRSTVGIDGRELPPIEMGVTRKSRVLAD